MATEADVFECYNCGRAFYSPVFNLSRESSRTHFDSAIPEIETRDAYVLECYCSASCREARRSLVMNNEGVPVRRVGIGPVEPCAICGGPVDMTRFHRAYTDTEDVPVSPFSMETLNAEFIAVVCSACDSRASLPVSASTELTQNA
jgi:hypothetical protein